MRAVPLEGVSKHKDEMPFILQPIYTFRGWKRSVCHVKMRKLLTTISVFPT
jgi:hypothetical protein